MHRRGLRAVVPIDERNIPIPKTPAERTHRACAFCGEQVLLATLRQHEHGLYGRSSYCRPCEDMLNKNMGHPPGVYCPIFDLHGWRARLAD